MAVQLAPSHDGSRGRQLVPLEGIPLDIAYLLVDHSSVEDLLALSSVRCSLSSGFVSLKYPSL